MLSLSSIIVLALLDGQLLSPETAIPVPMYINSPVHCSMYTSPALICLLDLLALLCELPLTSSLCSLRSRLGIHHVIPPSEAARIIANETLVVSIVVIGTGPEGKEVVQTPWEVVTTVGINGLEKTEDNPEIHCQNVELTSD
jgi:hypothetical protein